MAAYKMQVAPLIEKITLKRNKSNQFWLCLLAVLLIIILTVVIYKPVLFNFFLCSDLPYLSWLREAVNNPALILDGFCHHWMGDHDYYRPVTTIIWAIEYFICSANGLYLRTCTVAFMLLTSLILGLITYEIAKTSKSKLFSSSNKQLAWALCSAALFDFCPLHCEPINWFIAQHDVLVTLFCLLSFWTYLRWRNSCSKNLFIISLASFALGLLTKEMAATFPFILLSYELLCVSNKPLNRLTVLTKGLLTTFPYWLMLTIYLFLRRIVLNVLIGTATDTYYAGPVRMLQTWCHSIRKIFVPINTSTISQYSLIAIAWQATIVFIFFLSITLSKNRTTHA